MKTSRKILLSIGAVGAAASIAGLGTFATFTDSASVSQDISSGTINIDLGTPSSADNRLNVQAVGLIPGDSMQRRVKLSNPNTNNAQDLTSITLTTTATTSSLLDTDGTNGLQMKIEKCSGALGWRETGSGPYTYTCDSLLAGDNLGTRTTVLARRAIIGSALALSSMTATTVGNTDDMVVTVDLPSGADNTFQNKSSTIQYTFNTSQRTTAANK